MKTIHRLCVAALSAFALAGCSLNPSPPSEHPSTELPPTVQPISPPPSPSVVAQRGPVVGIRSFGGLCPGGVVCQSELTIFADGTYLVVHDDMSESGGQLNPGKVEALVDIIRQTDFEAVRARPFTGTCPTAYDGQESVFAFYTESGVEEVDSCQTEIDSNSPLFRSLLELETAIWGTE
jgi:hypothetical protein